MVQKKRASKAKATPASDATVTRVRAVDAKAKKPAKTTATESKKATPVATSTATAGSDLAAKKRRITPGTAAKPVKAAGGYFKGAWEELKQVRWPNRRATWSMTGAVLLYTAFFIILILLLDAGFKYLFELILGK